MLEKVKLALRKIDASFDSEISDLIASAKLDLNLAGIVNIDENDPLIQRAIILYTKANCGFGSDMERFQIQFARQKLSLQSSEKYTNM